MIGHGKHRFFSDNLCRICIIYRTFMSMANDKELVNELMLKMEQTLSVILEHFLIVTKYVHVTEQRNRTFMSFI